jgi:hypothetical protein
MYQSQFGQQQQQQLPFDPQAPQQQQLNLNLNNPPYVPEYNGDQYLQQIAPFVAAALAMEIQQNMGKNPLRMFMFNQYGRDGFRNADFHAIVVATLDFITLEMVNRRYQTAEAAAAQCVPALVEMMCALNLRNFPGLEAYIDQNMVNPLRNLIATFDQLANAITQMKNQASGGGGGWQQQNQNWQQQSPRSGFSGNQQQNQGNHSWRNSGPSQVGGTSSSLFSSSGSSGQTFGGGNAGGGTVSPGKYGATSTASETVAQPFISRKEAVMETTATVVDTPIFTQQPTEVLASSGLIKWKPSARWPYLPAYTPSKQELYFTIQADGTVEPIIKERNDAVMDYDKHATVASFGPVPKNLDLSGAQATMANIEQGIKQLNGATERAAEESATDTPEITTFVNRQVLLDTCENSAWFRGAMLRLTAPKDEVPAVYRTYALIADPVISLKDESDVIQNFSKSSTFIELREKLTAAIPEVSTELWSTANMKATTAINRVIAQNMSIPDLTIDSFVVDIQELIEHLGNKFGDNIQQAFLKHQRTLINSMFQSFEDATEDMSVNLFEGLNFPDGVEPKITFIASKYSLTYLNCISHELDIALTQGIAVGVMKALSPVMNELLVGLFKDAEEHGDLFYRHLLRTNDGRILEATRGYIGDDFYLLTLVK